MRTSIRPTVAEVELGAIRRNFLRIEKLVAPAAAWAVIKADAYGHGAVSVARALADHCTAFAVSLVEEGLELRAAGIRIPIVVLGAYYDRCHAQVLDEGLTPVIYDPVDLDLFSRAAAARSARIDVHIKVDTGMSRLGVDAAMLASILDQAAALPGVRVAGLCTHFATADASAGDGTRQALDRFRACVAVATSRGLSPLVTHAANSAAAVRFPEARLDAVRPGLALYGTMSSMSLSVPELEPALRFTTKVMAVRQIETGATVSYGARWQATRPSRIATLPVGYADGYPRHVQSQVAEVLLCGRRAPIVGVVCMDMMMIDVTDIPGAAVGDVVTLIGRDGADHISVDDVACWAGTINYEILCGISKRVPRIYKD
ncbi:MAG: alanine racemase [Deltaproteobacteria bacterium]|nr:alanine racemase [Deltaproteobacteria bacterium]